MSNTEIVQRVSSIATCDVKDLAQILAEALEKVSHFDRLSSKLACIEGVLKFCNEMFRIATSKGEISLEQYFIEITGGMTFAELNTEIDKCLGPETFWSFFLWGRGWKRLWSTKARKIFLDSFYDKEVKPLLPIVNNAATEMENSAAMLIPPDYRYPLAIETMLRFVKNLRASTWKECADLYEEQLHRWQMEANSAENLRLQREIRNLTGSAANNAKAAAIFSGLNLLLK